MNSTAQPARDPQAPLPIGPTGLPKQRPALAQLREAMTALHIGRLCRAVSYELFTYWSPGGTVFPSVKALADGMGLKRRSVRHHLAHLERVGLWVRIGREDETNLYVLHLPGEAQQGFAESSPRHAHAAPPARTCRTPGTHMPPEVTNKVPKEVPSASSRARVFCVCGNSWPDKAEYGTTCHKCGQDTSTGTPADEPQCCTCGDAFANAYRTSHDGRRCVDCKGEPSAAQRDAREKHGGGVHTRGGVDGGGVVRAAGPGIDTPPPETRVPHPDNYVPSGDKIPPGGGEGEDEPPPKSDRDALLRFWEKARGNSTASTIWGATHD